MHWYREEPAMTGKHNTMTCNKVIKRAIKDMTAELKLNQYPTVVFENNKDYVMAAGGTVYASGLFIQKITKTECDYVLRINKDAVTRCLRTYTLMFLSRKVAYDYLYLLVCHELRHMWQYQNQFTVGMEHNPISLDEVLHGHGSIPVEVDANQWMIKVAERKGIKSLASFMESEQRCSVFNQYDKAFRETLRKHYLDTTKSYNKALYYALILFN
jgi:hypothetical protein